MLCENRHWCGFSMQEQSYRRFKTCLQGK
jgi:hypothetical protein